MNYMVSSLFIMSLCLTSLDAFVDTKAPALTQERTVTIKQLLPPNTPGTLNISPAIPADFVALSPKGNLDINDWTFWGPQDVLKAYFKDTHALSQSIIGVKIGAITQKEIENPDRDKFIKNLAGMGVTNFRDVKVNWGTYPIYAVAGDVANQSIFIAWVGLNQPDGKTLKFQLVYPEKNRQPSEADAKLWTDFLNNTKSLQN